MRLGPKKRELIYGAAAEAVMRARVQIRMDHKGHGPAVDGILEAVDDVLFKAEINAGEWAVRAAETDARGNVTVDHIVPRSGQ